MITWSSTPHPNGTSELVTLEHLDGRCVFRVDPGEQYSHLLGQRADAEALAELRIDRARPVALHRTEPEHVAAERDHDAPPCCDTAVCRAEREIRTAYIAMFGAPPGIEWTHTQALRLVRERAAAVTERTIALARTVQEAL